MYWRVKYCEVPKKSLKYSYEPWGPVNDQSIYGAPTAEDQISGAWWGSSMLLRCYYFSKESGIHFKAASGVWPIKTCKFDFLWKQLVKNKFCVGDEKSRLGEGLGESWEMEILYAFFSISCEKNPTLVAATASLRPPLQCFLSLPTANLARLHGFNYFYCV